VPDQSWLGDALLIFKNVPVVTPKDTKAIPRRAPDTKFISSREIQLLNRSLNTDTIDTESNATNVSVAKIAPFTLYLLSIILLPKESRRMAFCIALMHLCQGPSRAAIASAYDV
jgi:hypothetical protein